MVTVGLAVAESPVELIVTLADGDHVYIVAPLATKFVLPPAHIAGVAGVTVTTGLGAMLTVTLAVSRQPVPPLVPTTVYVEVTAGCAPTDAPVFAVSESPDQL